MEQGVRSRRHAWFGAIAAAACLAGAWSAFAAGSMATATKKEDGGFQTAAPTAILIEAATGTVLYDKNADQLVAPASLAKLMTAEVVFNELKEGNIKLTTNSTSASTPGAKAARRPAARPCSPFCTAR